MSLSLFEQSPVYRMAMNQLDTVAAANDIDPNILERLRPIRKRALIVSVPV